MEKYNSKVFTLPNILSFFRIGLIPFIVRAYFRQKNYLLTLLLLILSGVTDIADGLIARRFNKVSNFGKIIDPIADKLTQLAVLFCLVSRYKLMLLPLTVLVLKELYAGISGLVTVKRTGKVQSADWHGKINTALLYFTMALHIIWFKIPDFVSVSLIVICTAMMLLSGVLYAVRNKNALKAQSERE